jgi:hypothetical protein
MTVAANTLYRNYQIVSLSLMSDPIRSLDAYRIMQAASFYKNVTETLRLPSYTALVFKNNRG